MMVFDILKYFSQFVSRAALDDFFLCPTGENYEQRMAEVLAVPDTFRDRSIGHLIFGVNTEAAKSKISQVHGKYLIVDYSHINSSVSHLDVKTDYFHVAVTVAVPHPSDEDQFAQALRQDDCLTSLAAIRVVMRHAMDRDRHLEWTAWPQKMTPFVAPSLSNSYGWTMEFDIQGVDIV